MAEFAPAAIKTLYSMIDHKLPNAVNSGIIGNAAHREGYHRSRKRLRMLLRFLDYSIRLAADKQGNGDACSALDISFPPDDLKKVTRRMIDAMKAHDPQIKNVREFIGTLDGQNVVCYNQYASGSGSRSHVGLITGSDAGDSSHLWHGHWSFLRDFCTSWTELKGVYEVVAGNEAAPKPRPIVSLSGIQQAFKAGTGADPTLDIGDNDIQQIQRAINARVDDDLSITGVAGPQTRRKYAILQCRLARLPERRAWPNKNFHPDADGIPGRESLKWLGFDVRP